MKNKKILAVMAVLIMLAVPFAATMLGSSDADSDPDYSDNGMDDIDLEPIDLPSGFGSGLLTASSPESLVMHDVGSWGWDETTGVGPFNSFYAAFDMDDGNRFVAVLDPYDLSKEISGDSLDDTKNYNIMWVVPTLYWSVDADGNVTITNDSTSGGTAYAHTIDGHVYNYIAIGVYHGDYRTLANGPTVLTSESGVAPEANHTRPDFRDKANNYTMDSSLNVSADNPAHSMLWNFYQWTMYKLIAYTVMEDFNSQAVVGNGNVNGGNYTLVTGGCDLLGPYAGNNGDLGSSGANAATYGQDYAKLFIEEPWGTVYDFVDGVVINNAEGYYLDSSSVPTDSKTVGGNVTLISATIPSYNFGSAISTDPAIWGCATATQSSSSYYNKGTCDKFGASTGDKLLYVGGDSSTSASSSVIYGVSYGNTYYLSYSNNYIGARLAFVFDAGPASNGGAAYSYTIDYDPTLMSTTSKAISVEGMKPISHNVSYEVTVTASEGGSIEGIGSVLVPEDTAISVSDTTLTVGTETFTAVTSDPTAQYTYSFRGWELENGDPVPASVSSDLNIVAAFNATVNLYTVTIESTETEFGTLTGTTLTDVPYGTVISSTDTTLTIGDTTVTATPIEGYRAVWSVSNGDTVQGNTTITATFELIPVPEPVENKLIKLIPLIVIIALTVMAAIALMSFTGNGIDLIKLLIGLTVCVLFVAMAMIPAVGGF